MSGKHFTLEDRINILMHVKQNHSMRMIATALNASASTVSRELKKHRIISFCHSYLQSNHEGPLDMQWLSTFLCM